MLAACRGFAVEDARHLVLPATAIFSKGPNDYHGEDLHIKVGRGAVIGWYVQADRQEEVKVFIEYACEQPLDQEYQLSLDGRDFFWEVPTTQASEWARVEVARFTVRAGMPVYLQLVPPSGRKYAHPLRFRHLILEGTTENNLRFLEKLEEPRIPDSQPGFGQKLAAVHPALAFRDLRVDDQLWRVSGMALRGSNQLLFTTWEGDLYAIDVGRLPTVGPPPYRRLAQGLSEPMGLAVLDDRVFITEKNEATELIDEDGDGRFETYRCLSHAWPCTLDYHEYLFGAVVQDSHLYFASSVAMGIRGTHNRQAPLRGSVVKVHLESGETEFVAGGLRTPDGIGSGPDGSILITDNQGEWLPGNKLIYLTQDAFYQFRSRPPWHPLDRAEPSPPAVWLPQGEIAASPTQPVLIPESWGPYRGQVIFGDATFGGLQRAFLEEVEGVYQGAVFPFSQGFRHLFHRLQFAPDGDLFAGGIARGNDKEFIERVSGLSQIRYTGRSVFEPLAARIDANGLEIEFTQPLAEGAGWDPAGYYVTQWGYQGTQTYGGAKIRHRRTDIHSASVSADRRRVFLEISQLVEGEVLHVRLSPTLLSSDGESLWAGELWYTVNRIPRDRKGDVLIPPKAGGHRDSPYFHFSEGNAGRVLYRTYCSACHSLDGTRLVGPSFAGIAGSRRQVRASITASLEEITADRKYLRQSIVEPNAQLVEGYPANLMPPIGGLLSDEQLDQLVDYLVRVSKADVAQQELAIPLRTVRPWTMLDFASISQQGSAAMPLDPGSAQRGWQAFMKAQCLQCHRFSDVGIDLGPDLTEVSQRYRGSRLLQQILEPSSEIHPKYQAQQFLLSDGRVITGMVVEETPETYVVTKNLLEPTARMFISKQAIEEQQPAKASAMPQGLVDVLTKAEIIDLLLFLENSGQPTSLFRATKVPHP
jgi:cytochrome c